MTSLALVAEPNAPAAPCAHDVLVRMADLRQDLERPDLTLDEALSARDQAATLRAYVQAARLGKSVADQAAELRLRAERRAGLELIRLLDAQALAPASRYNRRKNVAHLQRSETERLHLPRNTLRGLGIRGQDSSRWQLLGRLPEQEFETRLTAYREAGRTVSLAAFVRAAGQFRRGRNGKARTGTSFLLERALQLLRRVVELRTRDEVRMAEQVVALAETWSTVLKPRPRTDWRAERQVTCILCGRSRPASNPPRCPACHGVWLET